MNILLEAINKHKNTIFTFLCVFFLIELFRTAWISDDIQITLRVVLNFIHGYGPRFNIDERVQAYTHPSWFLILSAATFLIRNVFYATFLVSIAMSFFAFWLFLTKLSKNLPNVIIAACALMLSKAYIDFSSSGLENPLSHVLIILLVILAIKSTEKISQSSLIYFFLCCSFLYLNRPDLILLILPLIVYVFVKNIMSPKILSTSILVGIMPALAWTLFSLYYYGFPVANTAYAKLGAAIPFTEKIEQGFIYLLDSIGKDPLTLTLVGFGIFLGFCSSMFDKCLSLGIILYLIYIIVIGGDFMSGRFLTEVFLLSAIILTRFKLNKPQCIFVGIAIALLGTMSIQYTLFSDNKFAHGVVQKNGLTDERAYYFKKYGLVNISRTVLTVAEKPRSTQQTIHIHCGGLGTVALNDAYNAHYVDSCALTDPLLSHLPAKFDTEWRIGHFTREIPENYLKSIKENKNLLTDPKLHAYYDAIREITRGNLNSMDRIKKIIYINIGVIKPLKLDNENVE